MTLRSIAGYCFESALWKFIVDICDDIQEEKTTTWNILTPDTVFIEENCFHISKEGFCNVDEFSPPEGNINLEEASTIWSIGAMVCYLSSGHLIFGGQGGAYQKKHPNVSLPVLRKEHSALTPIVQRCLCYSPSQRIRLKDLSKQAANGLENSEKQLRKEIFKPIEVNNNNKTANDIWPDKMG